MTLGRWRFVRKRSCEKYTRVKQVSHSVYRITRPRWSSPPLMAHLPTGHEHARPLNSSLCLCVLVTLPTSATLMVEGVEWGPFIRYSGAVYPYVPMTAVVKWVLPSSGALASRARPKSDNLAVKSCQVDSTVDRVSILWFFFFFFFF